MCTWTQAVASLESEVLRRMRLRPALSTTLKQKYFPFFFPSHSTMHPCHGRQPETSVMLVVGGLMPLL